MSSVTILQLSATELQDMLDNAVARAVEASARKTGELWGTQQLADHLGVSASTVRSWERAGRLPRRKGTRWNKADVFAWFS